MSGKARIAILGLVVAAAAAGVWQGARLFQRADVPSPVRPNEQLLVDPLIAEIVNRHWSQASERPKDPAARARLGMAYHANNLHEAARQTYEQALAMDAKNPKLWFYLALVYEDGADLDQALQSIDRAMALQSNFAPLHWRKGIWLLDLGRIDEAERSISKSLSLDAKDTAARVALARVHLQRKQYQEAAAVLEKVLKDDANNPNQPYIRQLLGTAYRNLGRASEAAPDLAQTRGQAPQWTDAWSDEMLALRTGYGSIILKVERLLDAGLPAQAIQELQSVLRTRPDDVAALNYMADALYAQSQWDQGISTLLRVVRKDPNNFASHLNLSHGYENKGQTAQAMQHAKRAVEINPTNAAAHLQQGRLLVITKQYAEAVDPLNRAIQGGVDDPAVRIMLGNVLLSLRRFDEAKRAFGQAIQAAPNNAAGFVGMSRAVAELGDLPQAAQLLQRAQQLNPKEPNLAETARRLRELQLARSSGAR